MRNYHEGTQSDKWKMIWNYQGLCLLHFSKFSTLEPSCQIVYGQITKNTDRIEDRKLAITFKVRNCTISSWSYFTAKCSRNPSKLVSVSSPIEPTWFLPLLYKIFFKIGFYEKFMGFQKKILFQNNQKTITNTIQAKDFTHILYF